ncbi:unnamed protein product [Brassica oleracea var. botrytis]|uniref:(rape) hypothetical protein n=1 Tax=Brassica napus TaxID=3708 RepID=A0A816K9G5_BRANA|nr:unnamed protein product [Brassica napus]
MPLWRETSVELSSLRSKGLHPRLYFSCLQFFFSILLHFHVATMYLVMDLNSSTKDSSSDTASTTILSEKYADFTKQRNLSARAASMLVSL